MTKVLNGWDAWYAQWDENRANEPEPTEVSIIPYSVIEECGEVFCQYVMLNDHWTGYTHPEPMSLEDGMSIAFVLYDAGVNVDDLLDVLEAFHPLEGAPMGFGIPLCWLTEPMDHAQDLLDMLGNVLELDPEITEQMQQMLEETLVDAVIDVEEMPDLFRAMISHTAQWLLEMMRILGDHGMLALRAWWQGRLIILLREASTSKPRRSQRRRQPGSGEMPSAFRDLIQSLDFKGLGADVEGEETDTPRAK